MKLVSIKSMPKEAKIRLLKGLGYDSDGEFVLNSKGERVKDRYIEDLDVTLSNMIIFPGSAIFIDDNPLSVAAYLNEFDVSL